MKWGAHRVLGEQIHLWPPLVELARVRAHLSHSTLTACTDLTPRDLNTDTTLVSLAGNIHPKERQSQGAAKPPHNSVPLYLSSPWHT